MSVQDLKIRVLEVLEAHPQGLLRGSVIWEIDNNYQRYSQIGDAILELAENQPPLVLLRTGKGHWIISWAGRRYLRKELRTAVERSILNTLSTAIIELNTSEHIAEELGIDVSKAGEVLEQLTSEGVIGKMPDRECYFLTNGSESRWERLRQN